MFILASHVLYTVFMYLRRRVFVNMLHFIVAFAFGDTKTKGLCWLDTVVVLWRHSHMFWLLSDVINMLISRVTAHWSISF